MATVNFSVPDDVKTAFSETFAGENKSAIVARLMRTAVEERRRQERRAVAIDELLKLRDRAPPATGAQVSRARRAGRP